MFFYNLKWKKNFAFKKPNKSDEVNQKFEFIIKATTYSMPNRIITQISTKYKQRHMNA